MGKKLISVIGNGKIKQDFDEYNIAFTVGKLLIDNNFRLVTGGLGGVMEAASKGARNSSNHKDGDIIGILPSLTPESANNYVDVPIATGMNINRNIIVANSYAVIAIGGGSGTLSEIAFAWQLRKLILAWRGSGWSKKLADMPLDLRRENDKSIDNMIFGFDDPSEVISILKKHISKYLDV